VAGVVLTPAADSRNVRTYARDQAQRIFDGIRSSSLYAGSLLPVMTVDKSLVEVGGRGVGQGVQGNREVLGGGG
jgi:hypothetical protein